MEFFQNTGQSITRPSSFSSQLGYHLAATAAAWSSMERRILLILALILLTSSPRTGNGQVSKSVSVVQFPKRGAANVSPDTHLALTFSEPRALGKSGDIRVFDAADGHLVDVLDLAVPAGPPPRSGRGGVSAATPEPTYQKDV